MVEVFKTNVLHPAEARKMEGLLRAAFPDCEFNFDLEDCDKIFRIRAAGDVAEKVIAIFHEQHYTCFILS